MADLTDKDFKKLYGEVIKDVETITTKWSPSVSDEGDPGVAILKTFALFLNKLDYKRNYRNAQNSVRNATDILEAQEVFADLGYQMKKKKSATGELNIKYLGNGTDGDFAFIDLFTQFSNQTGSLTYTSVRAFANIPAGESRLIKVQEGIPTRYSYEGVDIFGPENLTNNLRLPLMGLSEISMNGVVITSAKEDYLGHISDWLNIGDSLFNSVETNNLYSIGHDEKGSPYIQFYEESLEGLKGGIGIWIISSSGSAGNVGPNRINKISSTLENGDTEAISITHSEFTNGEDAESIESALKNYYETFGINETLVGERDYKIAIEKELGPELKPLVSKALVTGVDGLQNLVEIVSKISENKRIILTRFTYLRTLLSAIFVSALKYSKNYEESFEYLKSDEAEKLIKKALFKRRVVSNDLILVNKTQLKNGVRSTESDSTLYNKFIFDITTLVGTLIIDSVDSTEKIKEQVVSILSSEFISKNLTLGEMISESSISEKIKDNLPGVIGSSFYYSGHRLSKKAISPTSEYNLSDEEKRDLVARNVLKGNLPLFKQTDIQVHPGARMVKYYPSRDENNSSLDLSKKISKIKAEFGLSQPGSENTLKSNELIQFYKVAYEDDTSYGIGVTYKLLAPQHTLKVDTAILSNSLLKKGSIIAKNSRFYSSGTYGVNVAMINSSADGSGPIVEQQGDYYKFLKDYKVSDTISVNMGGSSFLAKDTVVADGSSLNNEIIYGLVIPNNVEFDLNSVEGGAQLLLQPTNDSTQITKYPSNGKSIIRLENFEGGLKSSGGLGSEMGEDGLKIMSEKIVVLSESSFELSPKFYYGLILSDGKTSLPEQGEYLLQEGEHLIYSDENLLDFVDLGSGTLITSTRGNLGVLNNIVTFEDDFASTLQKFPSGIALKISNTEIYTFAENEKVTYPNSVGLGPNWNRIPSGEEIIVKSKDGEFKFDQKYFHREGLLLKSALDTSGKTGSFNLESGQKLTLIFSDGSSSEISPDKEGMTNLTVSLNEPLYLNATDTPLPGSANLKIATYKLDSINALPTYPNDIKMVYDRENGFTLSYTYNVEGDANRSFQLATGNHWYLLELTANFKDSNSYVTVKPADSNFLDKVIILNNSSDAFDVIGTTGSGVPDNRKLYTGKHTLLIRGGGGNSLIFNLMNGQIGDGVEISKFKEIDNLNPDLSYTITEEEVPVVDPSQYYLAELSESGNYNATFDENEGKWLLERINELITGGEDSVVPFDYFYETESPLKHPTEALKYYDSDHILNRNILTVLDFEKIKNNLKVVKKNR